MAASHIQTGTNTLTIAAADTGSANNLIVIDWLSIGGVNTAADEWSITIGGFTFWKETAPANESYSKYFEFSGGLPVWTTSAKTDAPQATCAIVLNGADSGQFIMVGYHYAPPARVRN